jgi:hypothetical protein
MNRATFMRETHLASNPVGNPAIAGRNACNVQAAAAQRLSQNKRREPGLSWKTLSARLSSIRRGRWVCCYFVAAIIPSCCGSQVDSGG